MGTSQNWRQALENVVKVREQDLMAYMMRLKESLPPGLVTSLQKHGVFVEPDVSRDPIFRDAEELIRDELERWPAPAPPHGPPPGRPPVPPSVPPPAGYAAAHRIATAIEPEVCEIYLRIRTSLWNWPEFASLTRGARAIFEAVIELARDEKFPWYLPVCSEDVRALARLAEGSFQRSVRELDCLMLTREAAMYRPADQMGVDDIAFMEGRLDAVPLDASAPSVSQFVLKYRRGIPWNRKRAAWWINYDLLCETGRLLPMFDANLRRLPVPYFQRNRRMGGSSGEVFSESWLAAQREQISQNGPMMPIGSRAPLWRMPKPTRDSEAGRSLR